MFDKLVESTKSEKKGRSKFFVAMSLIYGVSLSVLGVLSIMWFNPAPAEAFNLKIIMAPPLLPASKAPEPITHVSEPSPAWIPPATPPRTIADPRTVTPAPRLTPRTDYIPGTPHIGTDIGTPSPFISEGNERDVPPPPAPTPTPSPKATPTPAATPEPQKIVQMTSSMITGKAVRKVQPPYPAMAKAAHIAGPVQIQILISEEGRVVSASTVNGHPLLRDASVQAAKEWVFSPTILNGKGVKVSGILTFNFTLN